MSAMKVTSYNKNGEQIKTKDVVLTNENVYKILKKYIHKPLSTVPSNTGKTLVGV